MTAVPNLAAGKSVPALRTISRPHCYLCAGPGDLLYTDLSDRVASSRGSWNMRECLRCRLLWLDPAPHPDYIGQAYEGYFTHEVGERPVSYLVRKYESVKRAYFRRAFGYPVNASAGDRILAALLAAMPWRVDYLKSHVLHLGHRRPPCSALDVGCGSGAELRTLQSLGWDVEGLDFDPVVVKQAQARGLRVRLGTVEDQHYPAATFDAVTMRHVIEHVYDPIALIAECARILKPGGQLVMLTPNAESWGRRTFGHAWAYLDPPRHLFLFTHESLLKVAKRAGLRDATVRTSAGCAALMHEGSRNIQRTGRHVFRASGSLGQRLSRESIEVFAWLNRCVHPFEGEELLFIGRP